LPFNKIFIMSNPADKEEEDKDEGPTKQEPDKVVIMFKAVGSAPPLKIKKFKLASSASVQNVLDFLRKQLKYKPEESLYIFVNSSFMPNPEEIVGTLYKCFQNNGKLVINYSGTQAWG